MYNFVCSFILIFHIFPFLVVQGHFFGYLYLVTCWASFYIGLSSQRNENSSHFIVVHVKTFYFLLFFSLYLLIRLNYIIETFNALLFSSYFDLALSRATSRYDGTSIVNYFFNLGTICFFVICFISGARFLFLDFSKKVFYLLLLFLCFFIESSSLARVGVLLGFLLFFIPFLFNIRNQLSFLPPYYYLLFYIISLLILFLIFGFSTILRLSTFSLDIFIQKFYSYTIASYAAFFNFFHNYDFTNEWGFNSFTFFFKLFGLNAEQGFYGPTNTPYGPTNIYTIYRGLLSDFPLFLNFLIFFFLGYSISLLDKPLLSKMHLCFGFIALVFVFFIIFSPFTFTTFSISFIISILISNKVHVFTYVA
jgi:hypothetical protein